MARGKEPSEATIKTLFALSGNVCAFFDGEDRLACEMKLTDPSWNSVMAHVCHIVGYRPGGPRYDPSVPDEELHAFENLILLCPNHHSWVDSVKAGRYSVADLRAMKERNEQRAADFERWITKEQLAGNCHAICGPHAGAVESRGD